MFKNPKLLKYSKYACTQPQISNKNSVKCEVDYDVAIVVDAERDDGDGDDADDIDYYVNDVKILLGRMRNYYDVMDKSCF